MNTNKTTLRIVQDIYDFNQNKPEGIYLHVNKKDITKQYALIIGPNDTPYFGGFFFFEIIYPSNYPQKSPSVKFLTIDSKVRFNPNLYEEGKVCLSILGTWSGPSWSPVMNIRLVLESIRSLLGPFPILNEPGLENTKSTDIRSMEYNQYLIYFTYKIAILDVLNNFYNMVSCFFKDEIVNEFNKNKTKLMEDLLSYSIIYGNSEVESRVYFMKKSKLDFTNLVQDFNRIKIENNI